MQSVSARFLAEIRSSQTVYTYVDAIAPNGNKVRLNVTDGSVTIDRSAAVRRTCTFYCMQTDGQNDMPSINAALTPYGTEVRPYRGVRYDDGTTEVVPLGVYRISKVDITDQVGSSTPSIQVEAYDLSRTVSRNKFLSPYTVAAGTLATDAIKAILARTFPDLQYDLTGSGLTVTTPIVYDTGNDPWTSVTDLATSFGCEIYFTASGRVRIAPSVDIDAMPSPVFTYIEGEDCTMTELDVGYNDEPGFNGIVLSGESADSTVAPVRSVMWDNVPSSPTYYLGPYGQVPQFVTDQTVQTQQDADNAAAALLKNLLGQTSGLVITAAVNPALDANDVIKVVRARSAVSGLYAIDKVVVPFMANATQEVDLRQKRTA